MTAFHFRLEKVLAWRRTQLELAEMEFRREAAALAELDRTASQLEARSTRTEAEVRHWTPLDGRDLAALSGFRIYVGRRVRELADQRASQARKLAEREQAMLEARRRCRLLERLRERRLAEWQSANAHEVEEVAAESYLARFARQSSIMDE
jgi:hypothetical protein